MHTACFSCHDGKQVTVVPKCGDYVQMYVNDKEDLLGILVKSGYCSRLVNSDAVVTVGGRKGDLDRTQPTGIPSGKPAKPVEQEGNPSDLNTSNEALNNSSGSYSSTSHSHLTSRSTYDVDSVPVFRRSKPTQPLSPGTFATDAGYSIQRRPIDSQRDGSTTPVDDTPPLSLQQQPLTKVAPPSGKDSNTRDPWSQEPAPFHTMQNMHHGSRLVSTTPDAAKYNIAHTQPSRLHLTSDQPSASERSSSFIPATSSTALNSQRQVSSSSDRDSSPCRDVQDTSTSSGGEYSFSVHQSSSDIKSNSRQVVNHQYVASDQQSQHNIVANQSRALNFPASFSPSRSTPSSQPDLRAEDEYPRAEHLPRSTAYAIRGHVIDATLTWSNGLQDIYAIFMPEYKRAARLNQRLIRLALKHHHHQQVGGGHTNPSTSTQSPRIPKPYNPGDVCAAYSKDRSLWFRSEIMQVQLVDSGF